jgi:hypothetical protein
MNNSSWVNYMEDGSCHSAHSGGSRRRSSTISMSMSLSWIDGFCSEESSSASTCQYQYLQFLSERNSELIPLSHTEGSLYDELDVSFVCLVREDKDSFLVHRNSEMVPGAVMDDSLYSHSSTTCSTSTSTSSNSSGDWYCNDADPAHEFEDTFPNNDLPEEDRVHQTSEQPQPTLTNPEILLAL